MEKQYLLPVTTMVEVMKSSSEVGMVQTHLSSRSGLLRGCIGQIILGQGHLYSSTILTRAGAILYEREQAYHLLEQFGDLEWRVVNSKMRRRAQNLMKH